MGMIVGHGIDLVNIDRIREILAKEGSHFEKRVFSAAEIAYCRKQRDPAPSFAARFAAKEAFGKATGLGLGASGDFVEVEVGRAENGAPRLLLKGRAAETLSKLRGRVSHLSLSHDGNMAIASVILEA